MSFAWVFVIWGNTKYIVGAVAAAYSLRLVGTRHKIILLYADLKIPAGMDKIFDKTISVPLLRFKVNALKTKRQQELYGGYFSETANTKWNCLRLTAFEKVMYVDSDIVFTKNCDHLFQLAAPAACFSSPFAEPYAPGGIKNVYGHIIHGDTIPPSKILASLRGGLVASGALVLLAPVKGAIDDHIKWMHEHEPYGHALSYSAIDEQSLCEWYASAGMAWTHMDQRYQYVPWKPKWLPWTKNPLRDASAIHFYHSKVWETGEGTDWPDVKVWWHAWHLLEDQYPAIAKSVRPFMTYYKTRSVLKLKK